MDAGDAEVAVIIPAGLTQSLTAQNAAPLNVEIYKDPSVSVGPAIVGSVVQDLNGARAAARRARHRGFRRRQAPRRSTIPPSPPTGARETVAPGEAAARSKGKTATQVAQAAYARAVTRLPGGHPEGYIEAFAVLYREFADGLIAWRAGKANPLPATLPGIVAGVRGMRFIERAIESNRIGSWVEF